MWNWSNASRPLLGALVLGSTLMGCVDNTVSLFIRQVQAPVLQGAACSFTNDPASPFVPVGVFDVALRRNYRMTPLLANQLLTRANMDQGRVETSFLNVQGFVVELHENSPDGPLIGPPFSVYQTVVVPPSLAAGTPGYAAASIEVIPAQVGIALRDAVCVTPPGARAPTTECPVPVVVSANRRVIVKLTAFGEALNQAGVESVPFLWPVTVCCGCTIQFPPESDSPEAVYPGPDCRNGAAVGGLGACSLGQDFDVDCRLCSGNNPLCNPVGFDTRPGMGEVCTP